MDARTGYLASDGTQMLVQGLIAAGEKRIPGLIPWSNFDARIVGTLEAPDGTRSWVIDLKVLDRDYIRGLVITPEVASDNRKLTTFLARYGAVILAPPEDLVPRGIPSAVRFVAYLDGASPRRVQAVDYLGWHDEYALFITPTHAIGADGHQEVWNSGVYPNPSIDNFTKGRWQYGFAHDYATAQRVLAEVLTWQEDTIAAVFGAWWATTLLKGQTVRAVSLFPICGLEAPSGSGKSKGFFESMVELNGNSRGGLVGTAPALRNEVAATRSGIVWIDDATDPTKYQEIIRAATSEGDMTKSGNDFASNESFTLRAPLLLSGEGVALGDQQALRERTVMLVPTQPVDQRRSLKGDYPQWDDVVALRDEFGHDFTQLAGWYVERALGLTDEYLAVLKKARGQAPGRVGDKLAILAAGAWLLDQLVGNGAWAQERVASWSSALAESTLEADNALTIAVLPWAIRRFGERRRTDALPLFRGKPVVPPVLVERDGDDTLTPPRVYVNTALLADYWQQEHGDRHQDFDRLYSARAQSQQAGRVTVGRSDRVTVTFTSAYGEKTRPTYGALKPEYAEAVLARALQTGDEGGEQA
ncbi:hypothetical protein [Microbacterium enclense]|uniref:hypothetical protein n=1 Tax=Microbacterium enclense TaxID=993073 RepID=UPI00341FFCA3